MTWFKHKCWFCGYVSRDVVFIVGDSNYQCVDRVSCQKRRYELFPWERPRRIGVHGEGMTAEDRAKATMASAKRPASNRDKL